MQNSLFYDRNIIQTWTFNSNGINRLPDSGVQGTFYYINSEFTNLDGFLYKQNKNYQYVTSVTGSSTSILSIKLSPPFLGGYVKETRDISTIGGVLFYTYANPIYTEYSKEIIKYGAIETFTASYINRSTINEIGFLVNGYREFLYLDRAIDDITQPNGWCYESNSYNWYFSSTASISPYYSIFGSGLETISENNYIATLIDYDYFNLDFTFSFTGGNTDDLIELFLVNQSDLKLGRTFWDEPFRSLTASGTFSDINLSARDNGIKKYLVFRPSMIGTRSSTYVGSLTNINIVGGYNPLNNLQIVPINDIQVLIPYSVYTFQSVINGITYSLSSKIGNGHFKSGIWENGVWNNGWRDDVEVKDFDDIYSSILYAYDISWKIKISGSTYSCGSFNIGDKVSIGNIVAIDINENRKLIKDFYTISNIDTELTWIEVSLDTTFPYRRIEKDSSNHKIKITKNIWLSGAFFNGYFSGVWNNGLFKGYPKITEMFNTHWIDGFFNGGHFNSNYPIFYFSNIISTLDCQVNNITLVFTNGHNLLPGDYITIEKDLIWVVDPPQEGQVNTTSPKLFNPSYNGMARVLSVNGYNVVVNKPQGVILSVPETGKVTRYAASSVIQNFKFYDTNRSRLKSNESSISSSIFSFNSWIDTNYDYTRSVTLGRDFKSYEPLTGKSINRNNLYGYPTYDILSSASRFRNSFDLDYGLYKLGTKYKIFTDFIGDASEFNEPFDPSLENITNFYNAGWTFSYINSNNILFNRSEAVISSNNSSILSNTIQDYIDSGVTGNELYVVATNSGCILNIDKVNVNKSRYTVVEFDVITYSIADSKFTYSNQNAYYLSTLGNGGTFSTPVTQLIDTKYVVTSNYIQNISILSSDITNIAVNVTLFCIGSELGNININLISPDGKIINLKSNNGLNVSPFSLIAQTQLIDTTFDISSTNSILTDNPPYNGTYSMSKNLSKGVTGYFSDSISISELVTTNASGTWSIFIQNEANVYPTLIDWNLLLTYKTYINDTSIEITPIVDLPILHFNNLNYEIASEATGNQQTNLIYRRMSYLPINQNINHLLVDNTFRFDSIEKTSPERFNGFGKNTSKKKYEYFYNKTDLMMSIQGNGEMGISQSMLILDNIKMYETDMIPFFKYFEDNNIYKGIQVPYEGIAPNIDYLNSDFVFVDNITIGIASVDNTIINPVICVPNIIDFATASIFVTTATPSNITTTSVLLGINILIEGNINYQTGGVFISILDNPIGSPIGIQSNNYGNFTGTINNLIPNTTYYVQAYVITIEVLSTGEILNTITTYGEVLSFSTVALPPNYSLIDYTTDYSI